MAFPASITPHQLFRFLAQLWRQCGVRCASRVCSEAVTPLGQIYMGIPQTCRQEVPYPQQPQEGPRSPIEATGVFPWLGIYSGPERPLWAS